MPGRARLPPPAPDKAAPLACPSEEQRASAPCRKRHAVAATLTRCRQPGGVQGPAKALLAWPQHLHSCNPRSEPYKVAPYHAVACRTRFWAALLQSTSNRSALQSRFPT